MRGESQVLLCISCVNWQRRASGQGRRTKNGGKAWKRPLLFLDQFALFMLRPGTIVFPDQRCVLRLLHSLKRGEMQSNASSTTTTSSDPIPRLLLGLLPVPVQTMVSLIDLGKLRDLSECALLYALVGAWWEYNGRTPFFSHHLTAKLVRKVLKNERAQDERALQGPSGS